MRFSPNCLNITGISLKKSNSIYRWWRRGRGWGRQERGIRPRSWHFWNRRNHWGQSSIRSRKIREWASRAYRFERGGSCRWKSVRTGRIWRSSTRKSTFYFGSYWGKFPKCLNNHDYIFFSQTGSEIFWDTDKTEWLQNKLCSMLSGIWGTHDGYFGSISSFNQNQKTRIRWDRQPNFAHWFWLVYLFRSNRYDNNGHYKLVFRGEDYIK